MQIQAIGRKRFKSRTENRGHAMQFSKAFGRLKAFGFG
jgi:hypothetical protein